MATTILGLQELFTEIQSIVTAKELKPDTQGLKLAFHIWEKYKKTVLTPNSTEVNAEAWDDLPEGDREAAREVVGKDLQHVLECFRDAANGDGPQDKCHIMYPEYASTRGIVSMLLVAAILVVVDLGAVICFWPAATDTRYATAINDTQTAVSQLATERESVTQAHGAIAKAQSALEKNANSKELRTKLEQEQKQLRETEQSVETARNQLEEAAVTLKDGGATEQALLGMVVLLGALGGLLHWIASLVKFVGNRQLLRSWLLYYPAMPFIGAALAPVIYMLLRVGLLSPSNNASDGTVIANLNLISIYAFAAMTGMFSRAAIDKLAEVFKTIFKTGDAESKDALRPPGRL